MRFIKTKLGVAGAAVTIVFLVGCIFSGTFMAVIPIKQSEFTAESGFYYFEVDLSNNSVWNDHKDEIKKIETVGFEVTMVNNGPADEKFSVYIEDIGTPKRASKAEVEANATLVLDSLPLPADDTTHISYGRSFRYIRNVEAMKKLVKKGEFHYYGVSTGGNVELYEILKGKVIITFLAGK